MTQTNVIPHVFFFPTASFEFWNRTQVLVGPENRHRLRNFFPYSFLILKSNTNFVWPRLLSSLMYFFFLQLLSNFEIKHKFYLAQITVIPYVFFSCAFFRNLKSNKFCLAQITVTPHVFMPKAACLDFILSVWHQENPISQRTLARGSGLDFSEQYKKSMLIHKSFAESDSLAPSSFPYATLPSRTLVRNNN